MMIIPYYAARFMFEKNAGESHIISEYKESSELEEDIRGIQPLMFEKNEKGVFVTVNPLDIQSKQYNATHSPQLHLGIDEEQAGFLYLFTKHI